MKKTLLIMVAFMATWNLNAQDIPDFTLTDTYGEVHNLHEYLAEEKVVLLDFFASWCQPCAASTPELNSFYINNGAGEEDLTVLSMSIYDQDDADAVNSLNWGGSFPKFPYAPENIDIFEYYNTELGLGSGGIPFFVLLFPNKNNPIESEIGRSDTGYGPNMFSISYQVTLNTWRSTVSTADITELEAMAIFPNPAIDQVFTNFTTTSAINASVEIYNAIGQKVHTIDQKSYAAGTHQVAINTADLANGIYVLSLTTAKGQRNVQFSIMK